VASVTAPKPSESPSNAAVTRVATATFSPTLGNRSKPSPSVQSAGGATPSIEEETQPPKTRDYDESVGF